MAFSLKGRVAIVTGNSTGLGKAIGLALGQAGAKVPVNFANNTARGKKAVEEFQKAGIETCLVQCDVTTEAGVDKLFAETEKQLGKVDVIVPNATCEQPLKSIEQYGWPVAACPRGSRRNGGESSISRARCFTGRSRRSVLTSPRRGARLAGRGAWPASWLRLASP